MVYALCVFVTGIFAVMLLVVVILKADYSNVIDSKHKSDYLLFLLAIILPKADWFQSSVKLCMRLLQAV